ncbi:MAG: M42 family metallopeptidase [Pseudomonadota bacterium]
MELKRLLDDLLIVPGVSGYEDPIRNRIRELISRHVDRVEIDSLGNLIATREGRGEGHLAFLAHMDELGLVVSNITDDGFIRFRKMGGIDDRILPSRHVRVFTREWKEVHAVIAWVPPHMSAEGQKNRDKVVSWQDMVIDIGSGSAKEVAALGLRVGDPVVFAKQISYLANDLMACRGMDNRAGCAALVSLIQALSETTVSPRITFIFTTQEEYGLRGASVAGFEVSADAAFAIDTASAPDFSGVPAVYRDQFRIGNGPVLRLVDTRMVASRPMSDYVERIASESGIPCQLGVVGGSTDAAAVQMAGRGLPSLAICIPCRYTHATVEVISLSDVEATIALLQKILETYPFGADWNAGRPMHKKEGLGK